MTYNAPAMLVLGSGLVCTHTKQFVTGILGGIGSTIYDVINMKQTADRLFGAENYNWSAFGPGRMMLLWADITTLHTEHLNKTRYSI